MTIPLGTYAPNTRKVRFFNVKCSVSLADNATATGLCNVICLQLIVWLFVNQCAHYSFVVLVCVHRNRIAFFGVREMDATVLLF